MVRLDKKYISFFYMALGLILISISINVFFVPNDIVSGGISGVGIVLNRIFGIPVSVSNIVLNIPLFAAAYFVMGKKYIAKSAVCTVLLSVVLQAVSVLPVFKGDLAISVIYGAVFDGAGIGFVLRSMTSTGGVDLLAATIHKIKPYISMGAIMFAANAAVIILGFYVFGTEKALYAVIATFISSKTADVVLEGLAFSKAAVIISEKSREIAQKIMTELGRGVTSLDGRGMFTGDEKNVLFCVFGYKETQVLKEIVRNIDKKAFIIVTDVKEVMGEGFKEFNKEI